MQRRKALATLAGCVAGALAPRWVGAQDEWPSRPVKIIAPVAPGGGVDLVARTMADRLSRSFNQSFIVENMGGGGGAIACQTVTRATPDGYTLMVGYVGTHGTNPAVRRLPYDAINGFTPIGMVGGTPNVLVVASSLPVSSLSEFINWCQANAARASYGSSGPGTLTHLVMEQFKEVARINLVHVPYRGIGPAMVDVMSGQLQAMFPGLAAALPHIRSQKLKPLAVTGAARHRLLPDVPTLEESGFAGFDGVQWYGIMGPARLPAAVVVKLNAEINRQLDNAELKERLSGEALDPMPMSSSAFAEYVRRDIAKWSALAKSRKLDIQ